MPAGWQCGIAPLASGLGVVLAGSSRPDNIARAAVQIESLAAFEKRFDAVDMLFTLMDTSVEARALGCPCEFGPRVPVITGERCSSAAAILDLEPPNPYASPSMRVNIDVVQGFTARTTRPLAAYVVGPVTLAAHLLGLTALVRVGLMDRELFGRILRHCNRIIKPYAAAQAEAGCTALVMLEPQVGVFSPLVYRRSIRAAHEDLARGLPGTILHVCGDTTPHVAAFAELEHIGALSLDSQVDFKACLDKHPQLQDKVLIGNIDTMTMLRQTPLEIGRAVTRLLADMQGQRFILSTGCDLDPDTPLENLDGFIETALAARQNGTDVTAGPLEGHGGG